jgi:thioredoxin family protein
VARVVRLILIGLATVGGVMGCRPVSRLPRLQRDWTVKRQAIVLNQADGAIAYRFHARDLHLVIGPGTPGTPVRVRVRIDGQPPGAAHGTDVDDQGNGTVTEPRLYQLVRQPGPVSERTFEATFLDPGVEAYAFTFG